MFERMIKTAAQRDDSLLEGACHGVVVRVHSNGLTKGDVHGGNGQHGGR